MSFFLLKKNTILGRKIAVLTIIVLVAICSLFLQGDVSAQVNLDATEERLRAELKRLEQEQAAVQASLDVQKAKTATIQRDVNILSDQIYSAELNIQKKNIEIARLRDTIELKQNTVAELAEKMEKSQIVMAELIRRTHEIDGVSLPEIVLGNENLTDFFSNLDSYATLQRQVEDLYKQVREIRAQTEEEKKQLAVQQNKELDVKKEIEGEKAVIATKKAEKDGLLSLSKESEAVYEDVLAEKRRRASEIRTALFQLRDSAGIPFGEALEYAQKAQKSTGVRAAFILAILKQESDLGKNVGTCNLAGQPDSKKWFSIMPGPNDGSWRDDQTIYKRIVKGLGLDVDSMPLSCPWGGGWGGAMGPSQFIPYTWQAYESRIASAVGVKTANPWDPEHAITATALYVKDLGASVGGYTAERTAALKYYAGNNWSLPQNAFYGNAVINHATEIQKQIDFLAEVD